MLARVRWMLALGALLVACQSDEEALASRFAAAATRSEAEAMTPAPAVRGRAMREEPSPLLRIIVGADGAIVDDSAPALSEWRSDRGGLVRRGREEGASAVLPLGPVTITAGDRSLHARLRPALMRAMTSVARFVRGPSSALLQAAPSIAFETVDAAACAARDAAVRTLEIVLECGDDPCVIPAFLVGPVTGAAAPAAEEALALRMTLLRAGVRLSGSGGTVAPDCQSIGEDDVITVPRAGDGYDAAGLARCLRRIKDEFPEERAIQIFAEPGVTWGDATDAMQIARENGDRPLFDEPILCARLAATRAVL